MNGWYRFARRIVGVYAALFFHEIVVIGREHVENGPKIIVGNHPNATDSFALPFVFPEWLHFSIQADIFTLPVVGEVLRRAGQISVRSKERAEFLRQAQEKLSAGYPVVIFPEGRLNFNGNLHRAGVGAALLAMQSGAPILPVGFYSNEKYIHIIPSRLFGRQTVGSWQFGGKIYCNFGKAIKLEGTDLSRETGSPESNNNQPLLELARQYTEDILKRIQLLSQESRELAQQAET
jgi:1-acyl-sn-glycerol-3-phosphate acyltransferase